MLIFNLSFGIGIIGMSFGYFGFMQIAVILWICNVYVTINLFIPVENIKRSEFSYLEDNLDEFNNSMLFRLIQNFVVLFKLENRKP